MTARRWPARATVGICRRILKLASHLVPRARRGEWIEEWESELWYWWAENDTRGARRGAGFKSVLLIVGAIPHAVWERKEDWSLDRVALDLRYAARQLRRSPGFTLIALTTLGLGVGANTTVFSLLNGLLLTPPAGVQQPYRLVQLARMQQGVDFDRISYPNYEDLRDATRALAGVVAHFESRLFVGRGVETRQVASQLVSGNYFVVLGMTPTMGRGFGPQDDQVGAHPVVVISHRYWRNEFGASPEAVGRTFFIAGQPFEVVGVAAPRFVGTEIVNEPIDLWVPMMMANLAQGRDPADQRFSTRGQSFLRMFGRMRDGYQFDEVRAEMALVAKQLRDDHPVNGRMVGIAVVPGIGLTPYDRGQMETVGVVLVAAVAVVLLITCANLANLLLVRGSARTREIGVRTALGACRSQLVRQLLTESIILSVGGGAVALALTLWTSRYLGALLPTPVAVEFGPDARVFAFTLVIALSTGLLFGVLPAWRTSHTDVVASLKEIPTHKTRHSFSLRGGLVVMQLALSVVLLVAAGLLLRSVQNARDADPGYQTRDVLVMSINVERAGYAQQRGVQFFDRLLEQVGTVPGVVSAAVSETIPIAHFPSGRAVLTSSEPLQPGQRPLQLRFNIVSLDFFETLGIPLFRGRNFSEIDTENAPLVAVVNEVLAANVWPGEDPIGQTLYYPGPNNGRTPVEVIGVVRNTQMRSLRAPPGPFMFIPFKQNYEPIMRLHVRTLGDPMAVSAGVLQRIEQLDESLPVYQVSTLQERVAGSLGETTLSAILITVFGALAILLAGVGLYGTIAFAVSQRRHEFGVRFALGAQHADVLRMMLRHGLGLAAVGMSIGLVGALGVTRLVGGLLYGVRPTDPATFGAIAGLLVTVALVASYVPARRATRVDPLEVLRSD